MTATDTLFTGSIPARYDRYLGPLLFEPYAEKAAERVRALQPRRILEVAAGTGIVTAAVHRALPEAELIATDLNPAMLDVAAAKFPGGGVHFQPADALDLPFGEGEFDVVLSQFGIMFFPDKVKGMAEARRVLRDGGTCLTIIWDSLERNPVSAVLGRAVAEEFPGDPPRFLERMPFSYFDQAQIEADMRAAGLTDVAIETVEASSRVDAHAAAQGMCVGSPMSAEIAERGPDAIERAALAAERALARFDGQEVPMSALFVTATK
ncbi:MAG TPA: class I SAM-dependent methyltransferase [Sphingomicrobium sp.]|nr:class I SAM-dependent methyltransferase [Sphingomicrobium sp.]